MGRVLGNGGDWFELVLGADHTDARGWQLRISDDTGGQSEDIRTLTFTEIAKRVKATRDASFETTSNGRTVNRTDEIACLGGAVRKGDWEPPETLVAVACMGGVELDFRHAALLEGTTEVQVFALMGGVDIKVPDDIDVEVSGFGFMGGFDHVSQHVPEPGRPLLRIKGIAIMGGCSVKVKPTKGASTGSRLAKRFRKLV